MIDEHLKRLERAARRRLVRDAARDLSLFIVAVALLAAVAVTWGAS